MSLGRGETFHSPERTWAVEGRKCGSFPASKPAYFERVERVEELREGSGVDGGKRREKSPVSLPHLLARALSLVLSYLSLE